MTSNPDPTESEIFASSDPFGTGSPAFGVAAPHAADNPPRPLDGAPPPTPTSSARPLLSCVEVHRHLHIYLDGELSAPQNRAVAHHLTLCPPCQRAHTFHLQLRTVVARKAVAPMPADVRERITRALGLD